MPNHVDTMTCDSCNHVRWRHIYGPAIQGCMVVGCQCPAKAGYSMARGPSIIEHYTLDGQTHEINQPRAPFPGTV
jgi:hypothetical protein